MSEHQTHTMIHGRDRLEQEPCRDRRGPRCWKTVGRWVGLPLAMALFCGLTLSGCSSGNGGAAAAQDRQEDPGQDKRVETFEIDPTSFVLLTDGVPSVEVQENATVYILLSDADVTFRPIDAGTRTIELDTDDIVIERPNLGMVTVIRDE